MNSVLDKIFEEMPTVFSSNRFCEKLLLAGITKEEIENGISKIYLHRKSGLRQINRRMWAKSEVTKKEVKIFREPIIKNNDTHITDISDEMLISIAKERGYKIFKMVEF